MEENKVLIYHYSTKNEKWYDATTNVVWYKDLGNCWYVVFEGSAEFYHVSYRNMRIFDKPVEIPFAELYYKDSPCYGAIKLLFFNQTIYKIFYETGFSRVAHPNEIKIIKDTLKENAQASGVMAYYRRVVEETAKTDDDLFLLQQFDDIDYVNEDSVLALYLKGQLEKRNKDVKYPIFPFELNYSQYKAIKMMFSNRISIIEGPPGTGKTQTILNFIANALLERASIAVVSNNNSATDNVYEKLDKHGYSFVAAQLGNADNVDAFFEKYTTKIPSFEEKTFNIHDIRNLSLSLPNYYANENKKRKRRTFSGFRN